MKIGILTYHRSHNYGALLQAIALRNVLCFLGHIVTFIDYWPGYHKRMYARINWQIVLNLKHPFYGFRYLKNRIVSWRPINRRINKFCLFIDKYITPYCSTLTEKYDIIVYGSDQIWRKQPELNDYNPVYFGNHNIPTSKHITYAASMGILSPQEEDKKKIQQLMSNFNVISVRENDLLTYLNVIGFSNVQISLDPTLLLSAEKWDAIIPRKCLLTERYAVFYEVIGNCFDETIMREFCDRKGLKLVILRTKALKHESDCELYSMTPDQFVNLIRYAHFVFTSSFHGMVFSIINHKQFICSASKNQSRFLSLMNNLDITNRFIEPMSQIPESISEIDYNHVETKLELLRTKSLDYLTSI